MFQDRDILIVLLASAIGLFLLWKLVTQRALRLQAEASLKEAKDALQLSESHLRGLMESAQDFVVYRLEIDPSAQHRARVVFASESVVDIMGVADVYDFYGTYLDYYARHEHELASPPQQLLGKKIEDVMPEPLTTRFMEAIAKALHYEEMQVVEFEMAPPNKSGDARDYESRLVVCGEDEVLSMVRDVSERKRNEARLRFQSQLLDSVKEAVIATDLEGNITFWGKGAERLYGHHSHDVLGRAIALVIPPENVEEERQRMRQVLEEGYWQGEYEQQRRDASRFWAATHISLVHDEYGRPSGMIGIVADITRRRDFERDLAASEARWQSLVQHAPEAIVLFDAAQDRFVECNDHAVNMFHASRGEILRSNPAKFSPLHQPDGSSSSERSRIWVERALSGETPVFEWVHQDANGECFTCEVRLLKLPPTSSALVRGSILNIEDRKRIEAERESLITDLEQKNAELERFTYTVSHDLKSPLITIRGFLGFLEKDAAEGKLDELREDVQEIAKATDKMHELLTELLDLSRIGRTAHLDEEVPLDDLVRDAVEMATRSAEFCSTNVQIEPNLPTVRGDTLRLREVFQNLIENSIKFSCNQSRPIVRVGSRLEDDEHVLFVEDNGIGIEPRFANRIFGLFEQLDPTREGSGVGLTIVKRIVEVHGGRIWVEDNPETPSDLGSGARFCFTLPIVERENESLHSSPHKPPKHLHTRPPTIS